MSTTDVVVVGAGTAGLALAVEAARLGLRATVVEQSDQVGGTLWRSWAQMSAAGTELQRQRGIQDTPELHFDDVMRISKSTADPRLVRLAVEQAPTTIDWLMSCGFDMDPAAPAILHFHEPYSIPRTYWGRNGGRSVLEVLLPLFEQACAKGLVDLRLNCAMGSLVMGSGVRVDGVRVHGPGRPVEELETPAVVLASGGYAGNPQLFPELTCGSPLVGPAAPTSNGSGITACAAIGARVVGGDLFLPTYGGILEKDSSWRSVGLDSYPQLTPQDREPWEIHVNVAGHRFVAEDSASVDVRENALTQQENLEFWIVYDEHIRSSAPPLLPRWSAEEIALAFDEHPSFVTAETLSELATRCGIDGAQLARTVASYNAAVSSGGGDPLGRRHLPAPIAQPPYFAIRNHGSTLKSPAGVEVDGQLRVVGAEGPVRNLFAIGEVIGGSRLSGRSFVSGMSVTPALSFGRLVARRLAGGDVEQPDGD